MLDSLGWKSTTSPAHPSPTDTVTFFYAGQNTWRYGSKNSGTIDATHLESYWQFMVYSSNKSKYSNDLANSMLRFMTIHYGFTFNCPAVGMLEKKNDNIKTEIYPNPAFNNELINVKSSNKINGIYIYNSQGKLLKTIKNSYSFYPSNLKKGIYYVKIEFKTGEIEPHKLCIF